MRIATYNINGISARLDNLRAWLKETQPDMACRRGSKCLYERFPAGAPKKGDPPAALALAGLLLLAGCDWFYGVQRDAQLATVPDYDCVERVIRQTPGVAAVERQQVTDSGQELTGMSLQKNARVDYFRYWGETGSGIRGVIQLSRNDDDSVGFGNYDLEMNREIPQSEIDATRPVMLAIERRLSERCGIREIPAGIHESCFRTECKPLP